MLRLMFKPPQRFKLMLKQKLWPRPRLPPKPLLRYLHMLKLLLEPKLVQRQAPRPELSKNQDMVLLFLSIIRKQFINIAWLSPLLTRIPTRSQLIFTPIKSLLLRL